jgi:hypothetical protein
VIGTAFLVTALIGSGIAVTAVIGSGIAAVCGHRPDVGRCNWDAGP